MSSRFNRKDPLGVEELLTEEEVAVRDTVRKLLSDIAAPFVAGWFERGEVPVRALAAQLGAVGLFGMTLDGYGCAGMSSVQYGVACQELEAVDSGIRSFVSVQGSLVMYAIHRFGTEEQKQEWLPRLASGGAIGCFALTEPDYGSDPGAMKTRARRDGSDWLLSGRKMWITNGTLADIALVWAQTDDGIRGFLVPSNSPGFAAPLMQHKWSLRASVTSEVVLDDVRIPAAALLPLATGLGSALSCLTEARYGIVWGAMGAARSAFEAALDYVGSREQFGRPLAGFQLTQQKLADMAIELGKGQLLALHLGRRKDAGTLDPTQVSMGKLNNARTALDICRTARAMLGANGISLEYPVIRHVANLETVVTYEGTAEMHALVVGQALTGIPAFR
jgi:glutaryl-CoA dehydrogenase